MAEPISLRPQRRRVAGRLHEQPPPALVATPPCPERGLVPARVDGQVGHRMVLALEAVTFTIGGDGGVVLPAEVGKLPHQGRSEFRERWRPAHRAQRHLQGLDPHRPLERSPGSYDPLAQERRLLLASDLPEVRQPWPERPIASDLADALRERCPKALVENAPLLERHLALPAVECDSSDVIVRRHQQVRRFRRVVVDDEIDGQAVVPSRQCVQDEILDPDAGMEELGLVPGSEEMRRRRGGNRFAGQGQIIADGCQVLGPGSRPIRVERAWRAAARIARQQTILTSSAGGKSTNWPWSRGAFRRDRCSDDIPRCPRRPRRR